jgi:hypothetical protein
VCNIKDFAVELINTYRVARFQVLTVASMKFRVFCDIVPRSDIDTMQF